MRISFVVSEFNYDITMPMLEQAKQHAAFLGAEVGREVLVPGVFDMPLAIKKLCEREDVDAIVCIGAVIEGDDGLKRVDPYAVLATVVKAVQELDDKIGEAA